MSVLGVRGGRGKEAGLGILCLALIGVRRGGAVLRRVGPKYLPSSGREGGRQGWKEVGRGGRGRSTSNVCS